MGAQIRLAHPTDAAGVRAIYAPYCESTCVSFEVVAPTVDEMQERMRRVTNDYPWLIGEVDGRIAGYVYASRHHERAAYRWSVDVAVYIDAAHHRRGLGRAMYETLFAILKEQGFFKAFAGVSLPNPASVGLHESMGFHPAAVYRGVGYKFGQWLDVGWWQRELQPERQNPPDPHPFSTISNSTAVAEVLAEAERRLTGIAGM